MPVEDRSARRTPRCKCQPGDAVPGLLKECTLVREHLTAVADQTEYTPDYITRRLDNIVAAGERAKALNGGVVIW